MKKIMWFMGALIYIAIGTHLYLLGYIPTNSLGEQLTSAIYIIFFRPIPIGLKLIFS